MGNISRKQLLVIIIICGALFMEGVFIMTPIVSNVIGTTKTLFSIYGKDIESLHEEEKQKNKTLTKKKRNIETLASSENSSAKWYEFLQSLLKEHKIAAERLKSTGVTSTGDLDVEEFSFHCKSTYPEIVNFIEAVEKSEFVCSVKNVHLISKSLIKNDLDIDISVLFYKKR